MNPASRLLVFCAALLLAVPLSSAETTCKVDNCGITITIKIAFSGADDSYINKAKSEIESFWNGPDGYRSVGDCNCRMTVKVETMKITNASQVNCNPGPPGYHCVMVTDFNTNPPRNQTSWAGAAFYRGYMYGVASGNGNNSQNGWWSNIMSSGGYRDIAHEAGHLMGLGHSTDNKSIMNNTLAAGPTQDDLENAAASVCGPNPCPDRCCCGNGVVEKGKGESCDPLAMPDGCGAGQSCCPVCCGCYIPLCIAANGEYLSQGECTSGCGAGSACYKNYKTGCWDCVKQAVVVHATCRDPSAIRGNLGCDHPAAWTTASASDLVPRYAALMGALFPDERLNFVTAEGDAAYAVTRGGALVDYGDGLIGDPTGTVHSDRQTLSEIAGRRLRPVQAISGGRITVEGNGVVNGLRFGFYIAMLRVYEGLWGSEAAPASGGPEFPQEYADEMARANAPPEGAGQPEGAGSVPDAGVER